jgi:hypothetical protein
MDLEWKREGQYLDTEVTVLGPGMKLSVWYEGLSKLADGEPRYNVSVFGNRLKTRSIDKVAGQQRAEAVAKKWLAEALAKFGDAQ